MCYEISVGLFGGIHRILQVILSRKIETLENELILNLFFLSQYLQKKKKNE